MFMEQSDKTYILDSINFLKQLRIKRSEKKLQKNCRIKARKFEKHSYHTCVSKGIWSLKVYADTLYFEK